MTANPANGTAYANRRASPPNLTRAALSVSLLFLSGPRNSHGYAGDDGRAF